MAATRKNDERKNGRRPQGNAKNRKRPGVIFWLAFVVIMALLFIVNGGLIKKTVTDSGLMQHLRGEASEENASDTAQSTGAETEAPPATPLQPAPARKPAETKGESQAAEPETPAPAAQPPQVALAQPEAQEPAEKPAEPAEEDAIPEAVQPAQLPPEEEPKPAGQTRKAVIYFVRIDNDGEITRAPVTRDLPDSTTPLADSLAALMAGPTTAEKAAGLTTLIPEGCRLISCSIKDGVASVNFSDDFQFKQTYGAEGYQGALWELVWTATEFPTVKAVQLLLDGSRIDFLGENIRVDRPLSRDSL
jgi:spore germination protein GerM